MPIYVYEKISTGEIEEVLQSMNQEHVYHGPDGTEIDEWRRLYTSPQIGADTKLDPFSARDFINRTGKTKDTIGALQDRAKEMSLRRTEIAGHDVIREKYVKEYEDRTKKKFLDRPKKIETPLATIDFSK